MITSVRLQNWTSFGALQTAPLEPITVLVGANNSGKSNFLRALRSAGEMDASLVHRPAASPTIAACGFDLAGTRGLVTWDLTTTFARGACSTHREVLTVDGEERVFNEWWNEDEPRRTLRLRGVATPSPRSGVLLRELRRSPFNGSIDAAHVDALDAVLDARFVHLSADAIRPENQLAPAATIQTDGAQLAALVARWTLEMPDRLEHFNATLRRCLPEVKRALAPIKGTGKVGLEFEQTDGERFDASVVSDGVVLFAALIAHALEAPKDGLVLVEEPERGLHPRRLAELLDILRTLVAERGTQFVLATHSASLLALLRDEPEAILLFRRTETGSEIRRLADVPALVANLERADPGEMLASGAFNEALRATGAGVAAE